MKGIFHHLFCISFICSFLLACNNEMHLAPVADINEFEPMPKTGVHRAANGETLYEVAWRYGLDYRIVAAQNKMQSPYKIQSGQKIYLRKSKPLSRLSQQPQFVLNESALKNELQSEQRFHANTKWLSPTKGKIIRPFSATNKGIDIAGTKGQLIYAIAPGKVVYAGDGLRGYGNLLIIKHDNIYLSAYAHNQALLVKEGDIVAKGQPIAKMGSSDTNQVVLHFELREAGKPIDPLNKIKVS